MSVAEPVTASKYPDVQNYIDGRFVEGGARRIDVTNPSDGSLLSRVPCSTSAELDAAVAAARRAFPKWSNTPIKERAQVFFRYKALLERHIDELACRR